MFEAKACRECYDCLLNYTMSMFRLRPMPLPDIPMGMWLHCSYALHAVRSAKHSSYSEYHVTVLSCLCVASCHISQSYSHAALIPRQDCTHTKVHSGSVDPQKNHRNYLITHSIYHVYPRYSAVLLIYNYIYI